MKPGFGKHYTFRLSIEESEDTVLDVVVGANENEGEVAKAKKAIQRLLNDFTPSFKKPEPAPAAPVFGPEDQTPVEPTAPPEPGSPSAPSPEPKPEGVRELVRLHYSECGSTFGTFLKNRQSDIACKCGHRIDLTVPLAGYRFTCPYCGKETWGQTNLEDPSIIATCKCGRSIELLWRREEKEYRN